MTDAKFAAYVEAHRKLVQADKLLAPHRRNPSMSLVRTSALIIGNAVDEERNRRLEAASQ